MKKLMIVALAALMSTGAVYASPFQDGKKETKECCVKCDDKCKKECGDKCKEGKCTKADTCKPGDAKKDCCKKEKQA